LVKPVDTAFAWVQNMPILGSSYAASQFFDFIRLFFCGQILNEADKNIITLLCGLSG